MDVENEGTVAGQDGSAVDQGTATIEPVEPQAAVEQDTAVDQGTVQNEGTVQSTGTVTDEVAVQGQDTVQSQGTVGDPDDDASERSEAQDDHESILRRISDLGQRYFRHAASVASSTGSANAVQLHVAQTAIAAGLEALVNLLVDRGVFSAEDYSRAHLDALNASVGTLPE